MYFLQWINANPSNLDSKNWNLLFYFQKYSSCLSCLQIWRHFRTHTDLIIFFLWCTHILLENSNTLARIETHIRNELYMPVTKNTRRVDHYGARFKRGHHSPCYMLFPVPIAHTHLCWLHLCPSTLYTISQLLQVFTTTHMHLNSP